ncbi:C2 domain-containing protein 5 [Trichoplax sp. H2]|nr:C2 domain-containing protein 5 [Trichoplax sp. H2]|eukprot:RDD41524.1 C2 domain-containing protein 5 [Trichoplax sp. H2]
MPAKINVKIVAGRNFPVMDRASDLADAFVEVKFGSNTYKTDVCKRTLNPSWKCDWFRFEADDEEVQDRCLEIKVLDHDTYTAHDAIGMVYVCLTPLLQRSSSQQLSGWFPVYDTLRGVRGELNIIVTVELFRDFNKFKESSCGVKMFSSTEIPHGYQITNILGLVEELVVNNDPEYEWRDKIRSSRTSNQARQRLLQRLSGEVQRKTGNKVIELNGNAVLGYRQCIDVEGESGIVVRGIGTAAVIRKLSIVSSPHLSTTHSRITNIDDQTIGSPDRIERPKKAFKDKIIQEVSSSPIDIDLHNQIQSKAPSTPVKNRCISVGKDGNLLIHASSTSSSDGIPSGPSVNPIVPTWQPPSGFDTTEFKFFTISSFPAGFLKSVGGIVSARSVKLLDKIDNPDESEVRDSWWRELRLEIQSHAKLLECDCVAGYSESLSICDDLCLLSAIGTAVNVSAQVTNAFRNDASSKSTDLGEEPHNSGCGIYHIPYQENELPLPTKINLCNFCSRGRVPDVLFNTIETPPEFAIRGRGCYIQARVIRSTRKAQKESHAYIVNEKLPFLVYELHQQLLSKLKIKGMNSLFGLQINVSIGDTAMAAVATATAVYLTALPSPDTPDFINNAETSGSDVHATSLKIIQQQLRETLATNTQLYGLQEENTDRNTASPTDEVRTPTDVVNPTIRDPGRHRRTESKGGLTEMKIAEDSPVKQLAYLQVDDLSTETLSVLLDEQLPKGLYQCNTDCLPGIRYLSSTFQTMTGVQYISIPSSNAHLSDFCKQANQYLHFKARKQLPCCLCGINHTLRLNGDEIELYTVATLLKLERKISFGSSDNAVIEGNVTVQADGSHTNMIFQFEDMNEQVQPHPKIKKEYKPTSVLVTTTSQIPSGRVDCYLGYFNMSFIRESTSIREFGDKAGFIYRALTEVHAIIRAYTRAIGGNAFLSYRLNELFIEDNTHRNQGQCLINISGDVAEVTVYEDSTSSVRRSTSYLNSMKRSTETLC